MFGAEYLLALMKIMTNVGFSIVTAIPTWWCWNRIIPVYAVEYIPEMFQTLPYWHIVYMLFLFTVIGEQIAKLIPRIVNISQEVGK